MHKFSDDSVKPGFRLFDEIVLAIQKLSDEEFDEIVQGKKK